MTGTSERLGSVRCIMQVETACLIIISDYVEFIFGITAKSISRRIIKPMDS